MAVLFEKTKLLTDKQFHYCPGCNHGIIHRLVAEVIDEMNLDGKVVGVAPVGCSVFAYDYFNCDMYEAAHGRGGDGKLLPVPCYANCKNGIKAIAKLCGINKNVTWHQSRHSYATTICLSNGVPIETLSKMMGHTSIRSTQIYAKITAEKVSSDMERLARQIESMEQFICQTI